MDMTFQYIIFFDIFLRFHRTAVIEFDEQDENLKTSGFLALTWTDQYLTWTPAGENNIEELFVVSKTSVSFNYSFKKRERKYENVCDIKISFRI